MIQPSHPLSGDLFLGLGLLNELETLSRLHVVAGREEVVEQDRDAYLKEDPVDHDLQAT